MAYEMCINDQFPKGKTYANEEFARTKINEFISELPQGREHDYTKHWQYVIIPVQRSVGLAGVKTRFQIVAIIGSQCRVPCLWFVDRGICVTNV